MKTIILIHGAWHGAWCWHKITPKLQQLGYQVIARDLPGLGNDSSPPASITLNHYVNTVSQWIHEAQHPVTLVGHSLAGITLSQVAEHIPHKIQKLIYLCAFYTKNNQSLLDIVELYNKDQNKLKYQYSNNNRIIGVHPSQTQELFYNKSPQEDILYAQKHLKPQALQPFAARIQVTNNNYGQVPKKYIACTHDASIPIHIQHHMIAQQPCEHTEINADHSPFFSNPNDLITQITS